MSAKIIFLARGHKNILATHKTTLEFTKEKEVSLQGDCIVAVASEFDSPLIRNFALTNKEAKVTIIAGDKFDSFTGTLNEDFSDENEIVMRLSDYNSSRTLMMRCSKSAKYLNRELVKELQKDQQIEVHIEATK